MQTYLGSARSRAGFSPSLGADSPAAAAPARARQVTTRASAATVNDLQVIGDTPSSQFYQNRTLADQLFQPIEGALEVAQDLAHSAGRRQAKARPQSGAVVGQRLSPQPQAVAREHRRQLHCPPAQLAPG